MRSRKGILSNNDRQADALHREPKQKKTFLLNLMSSPGAGKTTTLNQLVKLTGKNPKKLEKLLYEMSCIGLIEYNWENLEGKNPEHKKRYVLPLFVPRSAESINMNEKQLKEHPELAKFYERMSCETLETFRKAEKNGFVHQITNIDGPREITGNVVVIGGNIVCDVARTAVRCGANVSMYSLKVYEEMPCGPEEREECERDGIQIHAGWGPAEIITENGQCTGVTFKHCTRVKNAQGRFAPEYDESITEHMECGMVLYCIGQRVEWKELLKGTKVELNPNGTAKADPVTYQTAEPDIFVGGDVFNGQKFVVDAIAAGKEGAVSLCRYVQSHSSLTIGYNCRQFIALDKDNLAIEDYDNTPRQRPGYSEALRKTFLNDRTGFTPEQVKAETSCCLGCGASVVDPNKCIGCGVCTTKCAFDAIKLYRERPERSAMLRLEDKMKKILPYMVKRNIKIRLGKKEQ